MQSPPNPTLDLRKFAASVRRIGFIMKLTPFPATQADALSFGDDLTKGLAIINSMTPRERSRPKILNTSRRDRIARGSGTSRLDVDDLIKQFSTMKKMLDQMENPEPPW